MGREEDRRNWRDQLPGHAHKPVSSESIVHLQGCRCSECVGSGRRASSNLKVRYTHDHLIPAGLPPEQERCDGDRSIRLPSKVPTPGQPKSWKEGDPVLRAGDNPGDWHCPKCSNVNWAKRSHCNICKTSKDEVLEMAVREGSGGGYSERNLVEEAKRKRRKEEEHRETKKRKEEKQRCKYCKRFSCIC